jgi:hypothetical protein
MRVVKEERMEFDLDWVGVVLWLMDVWHGLREESRGKLLAGSYGWMDGWIVEREKRLQIHSWHSSELESKQAEVERWCWERLRNGMMRDVTFYFEPFFGDVSEDVNVIVKFRFWIDVYMRDGKLVPPPHDNDQWKLIN